MDADQPSPTVPGHGVGMEGFTPNFADVLAEYLLVLRARGCAQHTIANRRRLMERFAEQSGGRLAVGPSEIARFLSELTVSRNTLSLYASTLSLFFEHCASQQWIPSNPTAALPRIPYRPHPIHPLTLDEVRRALPLATERQRDIILVLLATGLRASELAGIRERDIDCEQGLVRIRGKGESQRTVAVSPRTLTALGRLDGRLTYNLIRNEFQRVSHKARIPEFRAHRLRHTFSVEFLRGPPGQPGGRLDLLQKLLGHRNLATTMVYIAYESQEEALEAQRALNPADRL